MSHKFKNSIKADVKFCICCGCLSYKNIPSKNVSGTNRNPLEIDPLSLKYRPISLKLNLSSIYHLNYIAHRKFGLLKIYEISKRYDLEQTITFKAIGLMDKIYLNNKNEISIDNLEKISLICILLSFQFNNYDFSGTNEENNNNKFIINRKNNKNRIFECYRYIKTKVKNFKYWQIFCLKYLDYHLDEYSAFDYINLFFHLGFIFTKENVNVNNKYKNCINILEIIINNNKICKYSHYIVALSILYINFSNEQYFNKSIFKYIYGVDFSKKKYRYCSKEINEIINDFYHLNYLIFVYNNRFINSDLKSHYLRNFNIYNYQDNNSESKNNFELIFRNGSESNRIISDIF